MKCYNLWTPSFHYLYCFSFDIAEKGAKKKALRISKSYTKLSAIYIPASIRTDLRLTTGKTYLVEAYKNTDKDKSDTQPYEGLLNSNGILSGLGAFYKYFNLSGSEEIEIFSDYQEAENGTPLEPTKITIAIQPPVLAQEQAAVVAGDGEDRGGNVGGEGVDTGDMRNVDGGGDDLRTTFSRHGFDAPHFETCEFKNYATWEPREEKDLYAALALVSSRGLMNYRFVCSTNERLLVDIGWRKKFPNGTKPDALLVEEINRSYSRYVLAEFKIKSSKFETNHAFDEVDVLICWEHDTANNGDARLPSKVYSLKDIIRRYLGENPDAIAM